jgi:hypothetical protein
MIASNTGPGVVTAVRRTLESKYPGAILRFADFQQGIKDNLVGDRMMAMLSGFFGLLAAVLVVVGLYGVLSYFITRRRNEIGIRIALGARRGQVIALVMRDTAAMLLIGLVLGTALTLLAGRAATAMLFGLKPYDFATLAFATMLLAIIAVLATWLPAVKASKLDPVAALRLSNGYSSASVILNRPASARSGLKRKLVVAGTIALGSLRSTASLFRSQSVPTRRVISNRVCQPSVRSVSTTAGISISGPSILNRVNSGGISFAAVWTQTSRRADAGFSVR